ncbi:MAG TPA: cation diffusion facilitator family transporter [Prolixibacteraceae bacterium]|nr:cation diffusion facilitator family transporter [Prolixibacteraceae bacterium]
MSHNHQHTTRNLAITVFLNGIITIAQFAGGIISGSLALISDALHNLSDVISVILAYLAHVIGMRPQTQKSTFGYKRAEILAAFINAISLIAISVYLLVEAGKRFFNPKEVDYLWMLGLGILGFLANGLSVVILHQNKEENLNIRAAYLHLIGDALTSLAVIAGGVCIWLFQIYWIDPLVTVLISIYIFVHTFKILKESVGILMQFAPPEIDQQDIIEVLQELQEISSVHHVHLWQLSDHKIYFEAHLVLAENYPVADTQAITLNAKQLLNSRFDITHTTFQYEYISSMDCVC